MKIAVTGATGFVGGALIRHALHAGCRLRALTRRPQDALSGVEWIPGALDRSETLAALVDGCDAVIHIAGAVNAADRAGFAAANIAGTQAVVEAARAAGLRRIVHVSSLAAREPQLSAYGWSKAEAERVVEASRLDWDMVRPPAVYGPGDRDLLALFKLAKRGVALLPPRGRLSAIHVDDLAKLLLALTLAPATYRIYEADDGRHDGWSHREFAQAVGDAVGRRIATFALPRPLLALGARVDRMVRGAGARLTPDRVAYFCHDDWTIDTSRRPPETLWTPAIETPDGLRQTAAAYRAAGWL